MNKIVRENYPIENLPDDLRQVVDPSRPVRLVLEQPDAEQRPGPLTKFAGLFAHRDVSADEAVARIRELRDEWDD